MTGVDIVEWAEKRAEVVNTAARSEVVSNIDNLDLAEIAEVVDRYFTVQCELRLLRVLISCSGLRMVRLQILLCLIVLTLLILLPLLVLLIV